MKIGIEKEEKLIRETNQLIFKVGGLKRGFKEQFQYNKAQLKKFQEKRKN